MTLLNYDDLTPEELRDLLVRRDREEGQGTRLRYAGQRLPWHIVRQVQPRRWRIDTKLSYGSEEEQAGNLVLEGENLQAMVSLYRYRNQVDLILTDPPYNTGKDFRYNDKWDEDPNDPELGRLVPEDDGSRHAKWLRFMAPRAWMMWEMLKPNGILAICIDHRELFRLGMLMDNIFDERNRLGIINWQKTTPKNDAQHVSTTTEYVLVYAKRKLTAKTGSVARSEKAEGRFANPDGDTLSDWKQDNLTARSGTDKNRYALQSPFTGEFHHSENRFWAYKKSKMKAWLEEWGSEYEEVDTRDGRGKALALKGWKAAKTAVAKSEVLSSARHNAEARLDGGNWPFLYWGMNGQQKPVRKSHKELVRAGAVPTSFWSDENEGPPLDDLGSMSWLAAQSGRSRDGREELDAIVGKGHGFETVKPLRLFKKIIQIWCPQRGVVMDPFAGSGTTAHAVLELNAEEEGSDRSFVLIEQGRPDKGDAYAKTLTAERVRRVASGIHVKNGHDTEPTNGLPGGFRYQRLTSKVDAEAVLALEREEMIDLLLTSHFDEGDRGSTSLRRLPAGDYQHLFATSGSGHGFFLVWDGPSKPSNLNMTTFRKIAEEAKTAGLSAPFHVYARRSTYLGPNVELYQIPNRILEKLGFNETMDSFNGRRDEMAHQEDVAV